MHTTPRLLLIRPEPQARALLEACEAALGRRVPAVIAPIMEIRAAPADFDPAAYAGFILTSANGARMAPDLAGLPVYCVGRQTAAAVDGPVAWVAADSRALVTRLLAERPAAPLLWLRGEHASGDISARLSRQGLQTDQVVIYHQRPLPPTPALLSALHGEGARVLPLYSPRSARLLGGHVERPGAGLRVIAISAAVAEAWQQQTGQESEVCTRPDGAEMTRRIIAALAGGSA